MSTDRFWYSVAAGALLLVAFVVGVYFYGNFAPLRAFLATPVREMAIGDLLAVLGVAALMFRRAQ